MRARGRVSIALVAALLAATLTGCQNREVVTGEDIPPPVVKEPDVSEHTSRLQADLYGSGNPYTVATVERLLARDDVSDAVVQLQAYGMKLSEEESYVLEGTVPGEGAAVTFIPFSPSGENWNESAILACVEHNGELSLAPALFDTTPPRGAGDYTKIAEGLWMAPIGVEGALRSSEDAQRFSAEFWSEWIDCVSDNIPQVVTGCYAVCVFMTIGYVHCVFTCISSQSLYTTVWCFVRTLLAQSLDDPERARQ